LTTYPTSGGVDEHGLAERQPPGLEQGMVGGEKGGREGGRRVPRHVVGHAVDVGRGHEAALGVTAGDGASDHPELPVEVTHPGEPRPIGGAGERRVDDHPLPHCDAVDLGADRRHGPGEVHPGDVRQREPGQCEPPVALHDVEVVERGGGDVDHDVHRPRLGVGDVAVLEDVGPARVLVQERLHDRVASYG
jgi:hypothetical protein